MDVVRAAARGEISPEELVSQLRSWKYDPQYKTTSLADDWEERPNSFDAVEYAYVAELIDEGAYELILEHPGHESNGRGGGLYTLALSWRVV